MRAAPWCRQKTTQADMPRKPIVGGNWKCNPDDPAKLDGLVANYPADLPYDKCDVYVCPSNLHVGIIYQKFPAAVMVAPQNCNFKVRARLGAPEARQSWSAPRD